MKHIFKKLHKSHHNDPSRSNETLAPSPATTSSSSSPSQSQQPCSDYGPSPPPQSATAELPAPPMCGSGGGGSSSSGVDYLSSEEEFQMQLGLAISASNSDLRDDPENDQIRAATLMSLETSDSVDGFRDEVLSAEALSRRYWDFGVLDYGEKVVDGFYDVYSVTMNPTTLGKMPSLTELEMNPGDSGFEAVIVNRTIDPMLQELEQVAHCIAIDCAPSSIGLFVNDLQSWLQITWVDKQTMQVLCCPDG